MSKEGSKLLSFLGLLERQLDGAFHMTGFPGQKEPLLVEIYLVWKMGCYGKPHSLKDRRSQLAERGGKQKILRWGDG